MIRAVIVLVMLAVTLWTAKSIESRPADHLAYPIDSFSGQLAEWSAAGDLPISTRSVGRLAPTEYLSRKYSRNDLDAGLFIAYYSEQKAGESMHSPKNCLPGSGWEIWDYGSAAVPANGRLVNVNRYSIQNGGNRMLVLYWYQSRQRIFANEYLGKLYLIHDALQDGRTGGSIVRITIPDQPRALDDAVAFASTLIPKMQALLEAP